jgi:four helix bundle protein
MDELLQKSKQLAVDTVLFVDTMEKTMVQSVLGKQLLRSGTSAGANYRAARRSKSPADFIAKLGIVEEEADETLYWTELLVETKKVIPHQVAHLQSKANEVLAMTVSSIRTSRVACRSS